MIFRRHENEVNFDPEVRIPEMEAEELMRRSKNPPIDRTNRGFHNRALNNAEKALRLRNIEAGSGIVLLMGSIISERVLELDLIPNTTISGIVTGLTVGILGSEISRQNQKAKVQQDSAVRWAAHEAKDAEAEDRDIPDWANHRLQAANKTSDEVLGINKKSNID